MPIRPAASGPTLPLALRSRLGRAAPLALALGPLGALPAHAQTPPPTRSEVLRVPEVAPVEIPETRAAPCNVAPVASPASAEGAPLEHVALEGVTAIDPAVLASEWAPLLGRPIDHPTMFNLAERIACRYREAGYAFATAQARTEDGAWTVRVNEGRVAQVVVEGGDEKAQAFVRKAFGSLAPGRPLRQADLRRGMTIARGYGFWNIRPMARPNAADPDAVDLVLTIVPPKAAVFVSAQNASSDTVGAWSAGANLIVNGLTPLNEKTVLGVFSGVGSDRQRGAQISSDALLTEGGLGVRGDLAWFEQKPHERPPNQDTVGVTKLARGELNHPLATLPDGLVTGRVGFEAVNQDTELLNGEATLRDRSRVAYAGVRVEGQAGEVSGSAGLTVRKGLEAFGASRAGDALLSRPEADPQATSVRFDAAATRPLGRGQVAVQAKGQWADAPLTAFEEFTWGGLEGGRGLDPGALYGDRGVAASVELTGAPHDLGGRWTVSPMAFVEAAQAWNEDKAYGAREQSAVTGGAGLRFSWNDRIHLDAIYAHPLAETRGVADELSGPRLHLGISAGYEINW
ncbi:ShlB/FhaC/HecB family hemolysin secretion/activation protein [Caulobacter sp. 17J65-9]|uniref:ShlB/FhaC/HecB family hemolysin secretion/activation protein n=1 Tax=Caulobacter sp. 17J65-9 TaxID=2709382 RepID=UPI0013CAE6A4|nr:ShlB/FhaC/HecB family hemolysin secretion/activation protein [Caulobacter sp. 17J65-9]NEX93532.1 ShlB/FhaC/HecB family hemolysin secretion/activation protein [Caulobacter sp. 17J65-9]